MDPLFLSVMVISKTLLYTYMHGCFWEVGTVITGPRRVPVKRIPKPIEARRPQCRKQLSIRQHQCRIPV